MPQQKLFQEIALPVLKPYPKYLGRPKQAVDLCIQPLLLLFLIQESEE
jgi:hypothetical protein